MDTRKLRQTKFWYQYQDSKEAKTIMGLIDYVEKLLSQNNTQAESIKGLLEKVNNYEEAMKQIKEIYKHGGTASRIAKKVLGE